MWDLADVGDSRWTEHAAHAPTHHCQWGGSRLTTIAWWCLIVLSKGNLIVWLQAASTCLILFHNKSVMGPTRTHQSTKRRLVGALSANGVIWEQTVEKTAEERWKCGDTWFDAHKGMKPLIISDLVALDSDIPGNLSVSIWLFLPFSSKRSLVL